MTVIKEFQSESLKGIELKISEYLKTNIYSKVIKITTYPIDHIWIVNVEFLEYERVTC